MRLPLERRRDAIALLVATVTVLAGITAWLVGDVDLGFQLATDEDGYVVIASVAPESEAADGGLFPGLYVQSIVRRDGSNAADRLTPYRDSNWDPSQPIRLVVEPVAPADIEDLQAIGIEVEGDQTWVAAMGGVNRYGAAGKLEGGGILLIVGVAVGFLVAGLIARGWLGHAWSGEGTVTGAAIATPLAALPLAYTGAWWGTAAGTLLTGAALLPLGWSLADAHPDPTWRTRLKAAAIGIAAIVVLLLIRGLAGSELLGTTPQRALLLAMLPLTLALAAGVAGGRPPGQATNLVAAGLMPAVAVLTQPRLAWGIAPLVMAAIGMLAWRFVPATYRSWFSSARGSAASGAAGEVEAEPNEGPTVQPARDGLALLIGGATLALGIAGRADTGTAILGGAAGFIAGLALRRGLLGPSWARAAIPIGTALATPMMALTLPPMFRLVLPGLAALVVAHQVAWRHPEAGWRRTLFGISATLLVVVTLVMAVVPSASPESARLSIYLMLGFIALVPGLGAAFFGSGPDAISPTQRLDLIAMGLTPGVAMTILPGYSPNPVLLIAWLIGLVAWRRFTIAPLLGLAQRTQRQRDLTVAAVEAERARLAADIHDDALQELSALVRRLDSAGDADGAELARSVAERLRAITSDLRLPLLDDLGAGPALEWLVGRFRPLTDGEVRLERADPTRPPAGVELAVFRVAQEAIANAVKHGRPPITVRYRVDDGGAVSLSVDDQGPGIPPDAPEEALRAGHLGVANMQQRAQQIGALLDIRRWPTGGTHVQLEWRPR
jgi:signal transduction histidine kinase